MAETNLLTTIFTIVILLAAIVIYCWACSCMISETNEGAAWMVIALLLIIAFGGLALISGNRIQNTATKAITIAVATPAPTDTPPPSAAIQEAPVVNDPLPTPNSEATHPRHCEMCGETVDNVDAIYCRNCGSELN